jgi:chorismate mutase/prephenate dehydratase
MTRIESRLSRKGKWNHVFFVDIEGHASDPKVAKALVALKARAHKAGCCSPRAVL